MKVLAWISGAGLALGLGTIILAIAFLVASVPSVVTNTGQPGSDVVAEMAPPGESSVDLVADTTYTFFAITPEGRRANSSGLPQVTAPDGEVVRIGQGISSSIGANGWNARSIGTFESSDAGTYRIIMPPVSATARPATVVLADYGGEMLGGIFSGVGGIFLGALLAFVGFLGLVIAIIVTVVRHSRPTTSGGPMPLQGHDHPGAPGPLPGAAGMPAGTVAPPPGVQPTGQIPPNPPPGTSQRPRG